MSDFHVQILLVVELLRPTGGAYETTGGIHYRKEKVFVFCLYCGLTSR